MSTPIIHLNYRFDRQEHQGIFYGHILGSTVVIGAKLEIIEKEEKTGYIKKIKGDFRSKVMGGTINFAVDKVSRNIKFKESKTHLIDIYLNMFDNKDAKLTSTTLIFQTPFNPKKHQLDVILRPDNISNWKKSLKNGMFNEDCPKPANWHQSCKVGFGGI